MGRGIEDRESQLTAVSSGWCSVKQSNSGSTGNGVRLPFQIGGLY